VKRIVLGEFEIGVFLGFGCGSTWRWGGGGTLSVTLLRFGGILCVELGWGGESWLRMLPCVIGVT
jgi:hypothetical protein